MKKYLLILLLAVTGLSACKKNDSSSDNYDATAQAAADDAKIQAYIKANNIDAIKDPTGIYYKIITPGTGSYPIATSTVNVTYTGKLLDGSVFDSNTISIGLSPDAYGNGGTIMGWRYGIPHINTGGTILLIIPSTLGYKNQVAGTIPANSVLTFTVTLNSFKL